MVSLRCWLADWEGDIIFGALPARASSSSTNSLLFADAAAQNRVSLLPSWHNVSGEKLMTIQRRGRRRRRDNCGDGKEKPSRRSSESLFDGGFMVALLRAVMNHVSTKGCSKERHCRHKSARSAGGMIAVEYSRRAIDLTALLLIINSKRRRSASGADIISGHH